MPCPTHEQLLRSAVNAAETWVRWSKTTSDQDLLGPMIDEATRTAQDFRRHVATCKACSSESRL